MCGRFYIDDETAAAIERVARRIDGLKQQPATGDVNPGNRALVLHTQQEELVSSVLTWGYNHKEGLIFNTRCESVESKPMFSRDFERHRCVIPANHFYEWKAAPGKEKEKFHFFLPGQPLYLAGIYHKNVQGDRFSILTRAAAGCMEGIHPRMPIVLSKEEISDWLTQRPTDFAQMLTGPTQLLREAEVREYTQLSLFDGWNL